MPTYIAAKNVVVSEKDGYADFVITLSAPSASEITVNYFTDNVSASYITDYTASGGGAKVVFTPGVTTQTVRVPLNNDTTVEKMESFAIQLSTTSNSVIINPVAQAFIVDNDTLADSTQRASLSVRDVVVDATADVATFAVVLDKATTGGFSVAYNLTNDSASAGSDYVAGSGTLTFGAGETVKNVSVPLPHDGNAEPAELFNLVLGAVTGASAAHVLVADGAGLATIGRHGQTPVAKPLVSVSNPIASEQDGYVDFVISLSAPSVNEVSVTYSTANAGASWTSDYAATGGVKLVFAPGVTTQTVRVALTDDTTVEKLEAFELELGNAVNAVIANPVGTATIVDNDTLADSAQRANLSVRDAVIDASADVVTFDVLLDKATNDTFSVAYNLVNGTASAGSDFATGSGTLTFGPGETAKTVSVTLPHDSVAEPAELFQLALGAVTGNAAGSVAIADGVGQATIGRHGQTAVAKPTVSVSNPFVSEQDGYVDFVISLSAPALSEVSVNCFTENETASWTSDYHATSSTRLVFAPGVTTQTVRVKVSDDSSAEALETFSMMLANPTNAVIGNAVGTATIVDNDTLADSTQRASLSVRDVVVDASADTATFSVLLDKAATGSFSVAYTLGNGSATPGADYIANNGTLTFGAGETVKTVTVPLLHENGAAMAERAEVFHLTLGTLSGSAATSVTIGDGSGQATIGLHGQTPVAKPAISASNPVASEKSGYAEFIVTLNAPSSNEVTVNYHTENGTANWQTPDYLSHSDKLVFAPGVTTQTVRFAIKDDGLAESAETFKLQLTTPVNATLATATATATIVDGAAHSVGSAAVDTTKVNGARANYTITPTAEGYALADSSGATQMLTGVERLQFSDTNIGLDINGAGGQAYRIYQAAFNRTPDAKGLGYWISMMDQGLSMLDVAASFIKSDEFIKAYGANLGNKAFMEQVYMNVLHRAPDTAGLNYWVDLLDKKHVNQAEVLSMVSDSPENQDALLPVIGNGFPYAPWG
jgi:hypothetical protein